MRFERCSSVSCGTDGRWAWGLAGLCGFGLFGGGSVSVAVLGLKGVDLGCGLFRGGRSAEEGGV